MTLGKISSNAPFKKVYGIGDANSATMGATSRNGFIAASPSSTGPDQCTTARANVSPCLFSGMKGSGGAIWNAGKAPDSTGAALIHSREKRNRSAAGQVSDPTAERQPRDPRR